MPCFTTVRTLIAHVDTLCRAFDAMGIQYTLTNGPSLILMIPAGQTFSTRWGQPGRVPFDARLLRDGLQYALDFGAYGSGSGREIVINAMQLIVQQYAMQTVEDLAIERGFEITELERLSDGSCRARMVSYRSGQMESIEAHITVDGTVSAKMDGASLHSVQGSEPVVKLLQARLGGEVLEDDSDHPHDDPGAALWRNDYDQVG